jgi:hypothetical protein
MDKLKCPICHAEVGERNFKETYVSPYNNQEHKYYECLNCEVLEHQDKPREFLEMVKGLLREGGYIAGSVPNMERLFVEIDWKCNHGDYPPHHFLRFSKSSLEKALNFSGFKEIEVYKLDFSSAKLFPYLEKKLFGNLDKLKIKLKGIVLGDERKARAYVLEELMEVSPSKGKAYILMGYVRKLKGNGFYLYFQVCHGSV